MSKKLEDATDAVLDALEETDLTVAEVIAVLEIVKHSMLNLLDGIQPQGETLQ